MNHLVHQAHSLPPTTRFSSTLCTLDIARSPSAFFIIVLLICLPSSTAAAGSSSSPFLCGNIVCFQYHMVYFLIDVWWQRCWRRENFQQCPDVFSSECV
mmetsp:Transcript_54757/g.91006  ORF Transcript_54757/g.91006 Transcript_54757/m.91006 type:complete len:99 (+) Transcript_54757:615-911(+)